MTLNQTKFSELVDCSQQNISKLIKKGILEKESNGKLDVDKSLLRLKEFDLLDDKNKLKKARTPNKTEKKKVESAALPLESENVGYKSFADLTDEEKKQAEEEERKAFDELKLKEKEAADKNISGSDGFSTNLEKFNYANSKAHRETFLAKTAELDFKIKMGEFVEKKRVENLWFEVSRIIRDGLDSLEHKIPVRVIGKKDIDEIQDITREEKDTIKENFELKIKELLS